MDVLAPCSPDQQYCWEEFTGNTMVQHDLKGNMLFLHTNLSPKWNLHIPGDFRAYSRRLVIQLLLIYMLIQSPYSCSTALLPVAPEAEVPLCRWQVFASKRSFADIMTYLGYDIEYEVWSSLVDFQCSAVFAGYTQVCIVIGRVGLGQICIGA